MKKLLLAVVLFPVAALAQPAAKYQPPTPTPWFNITPGAPAQTINAWAADEYGRPQTVAIGSAAAALQPDIVAAGTIDMTNASDTEVFSCDGRSTVAIQFNRGSETGSVAFEVTTDNTTWIRIYEIFFKTQSGSPLEINQEAASTVNVTLINAKIYLFDCAGKKSVRVAVTSAGTGTALPVTFRASAFPSGLINNIRPGTTSTSLGKAEDAAHTSGDVGVLNLGVYQSTPSQLAGTTLDYSPVTTGPEGGVYTQAIAGSVGGATIHRVISAATNNSTNVKASAGTILSITACNINAAVRYLKLYNSSSAPTCGSGTPVLTLPIPVNNCAPVALPPSGLAFGTGIGYCIVTGAADTDNTSTAANEQFVTIGYK